MRNQAARLSNMMETFRHYDAKKKVADVTNFSQPQLSVTMENASFSTLGILLRAAITTFRDYTGEIHDVRLAQSSKFFDPFT